MGSNVLKSTEKRKPPNAGKGRVKGVPNKVTRDLREMILGALDAVGGQKYLQSQARENPQAFLTLVGRVLPKDINLGQGVSIKVNLIGRGSNGP